MYCMLCTHNAASFIYTILDVVEEGQKFFLRQIIYSAHIQYYNTVEQYCINVNIQNQSLQETFNLNSCKLTLSKRMS